MQQAAIAPLPSTQARVSLSAFRHNLTAVRRYIGAGPKIMAVVKANAYGHGAAVIAHEAVHNGADVLGVARIHEGVELRRAGLEAPILVFEVPPDDQIGTALHHRLMLTIAGNGHAVRISEMAKRLRLPAVIHAKVDTGMSRLGFPHDSAAEVLAHAVKLPGVELAGIYSHFATSDEEDPAFALVQLKRFQEVAEGLRKAGVEVPVKHMANSGAIISTPEAHLDMVRPGIMLYGYAPRPGLPQRHTLQPVLSLVSRVALVKTVAAGTPVSYNRRYTTPSETRLATVPVGYADGYPRLLTNRASALIRGRRYPVVGTICMDQLMVDLGPDSDVVQGEEVILIGRSGAETIDADDVARTVGTISYEVTCLITARVPRIYVD
jgi:alanine racemase